VPDAAGLLGDPAVLASVGDLDFLARGIVDGVVSGLHRSPFHGFSAEFHQYRHYRPGDDLKFVDWKLFARTDRLYTKQYRETTNMPVCLVVDASASMGFRGRGALTKLRYAIVLAAAFSHLLVRQGDQVALLLGDGGEGRYLAPRGGRMHQRAVLHALARAEARDTWPAALAVRTATQRLSRRGVLIVISDLYDDETAVLDELTHAAAMGHEIALFQVMTPDEIEFPITGVHEFDDLETGARRDVDATLVAARYRARVTAFLDRVGTTAHAAGLGYSLARTDVAPADVLRRFLVRHPGSGRGR